jgi:hypothetical protein
MINISQVSDAGTAATLEAGSAQNQVLKLDPDGKIPAIDGSNLINVGGGSGGGGSAATPDLITHAVTNNNITLPTTYSNGTVVFFETNTQTAHISVYLPSASSFSSGYFLELSRSATPSGVTSWRIYLYADGSDTLGDSTEETLYAHDSYTLVSDGSSAWYKFGIGGI